MREHYDKLLALVVGLALLVTLVILGWRLGGMRSAQQDFNARLDELTPAHPRAVKADIRPYEEAEAKLKEPFQLPDWTNSLFVPETRVYCVDCRRPIPFYAEKCPFCGAEQPPLEEKLEDKDADGMLDEWEAKWGFNPHDPRDAELDSDQDGFTNLEEFRAGTNPKDSQSHPPITAKLYVKNIETMPFKLLFKSALKMPDGSLKFALNTREFNPKTYFVKVGDTNIEGFDIVKYEPRVITVPLGTISGAVQRVDASVLTLRRNNKLIPLERGKEQQWQDYTVHLFFAAENREIVVKSDGVFRLKDREYKLISVDIEKEAVVIEDTLDRSRVEIGKVPSLTSARDFVE